MTVCLDVCETEMFWGRDDDSQFETETDSRID